MLKAKNHAHKPTKPTSCGGVVFTLKKKYANSFSSQSQVNSLSYADWRKTDMDGGDTSTTTIQQTVSEENGIGKRLSTLSPNGEEDRLITEDRGKDPRKIARKYASLLFLFKILDFVVGASVGSCCIFAFLLIGNCYLCKIGKSRVTSCREMTRKTPRGTSNEEVPFMMHDFMRK